MAMLLFVSACGFRPLYGEKQTQPGQATINESLSAIVVYPISDRTGQQMHNLLRDRLNPLGQPDQPVYGLRVSLKEKLKSLGIRRDATATRANLTMTAKYSLVDLRTKKVLFKDQSFSTNSYDILDDQFATYVSENSARERALTALSDQMKTRLAVYFEANQI
ncbi:MAG: LPS assembly lipoprotein LptE [Pseudomonadota bacterium]